MVEEIPSEDPIDESVGRRLGVVLVSSALIVDGAPPFGTIDTFAMMVSG